jgi:signal transduction histidine kinase
VYYSEIQPAEAAELRQHPLVGPYFESAAAWTLFPLKTASAMVGTLHLTFENSLDDARERLWLLSALADMAATALQRLTFLDALEQQVVDRAHDLEALYDIAALTSASADVQSVLERSFARILVAMQTQTGAVQLLDASDSALTLALQVGLSDEMAQHLAVQSARSGFGGWVVEHSEPLVVSDVIADPRAGGWSAVATPQIYLGVPLRTKSRTLGVISVFRKIGKMFKPEEVSLLSSMADHVGVAIENAQLQRQVEHTAVMVERQRLARDLHDAVTQTLYSLTLFTEGARELIQANDVERAQQYLAEIAVAARQALKEMRLLIYELRPPILEREGLAGALRHRLDAVEGRAQVRTRLLVEGVIEIAPPLAVELYYIAQEALNNVLKHAMASMVTVQIRVDAECVELNVLDDGVGFSPDQSAEAGMGLTNIRERVKKLGGTVAIVSAPDQGTQLKVKVCTSQER